MGMTIKSPTGEMLKIIDGKCYSEGKALTGSFHTGTGVNISDTMAASSINMWGWDG